MPQSHTVLVTGSAGAIGQPVCRELIARGHRVRGFDLHQTPGVDDAIVGDIADGDAVRRAVDGIDSVVHLAAATDDADFLDVLLRPNVIGLFNVMDAARRANVRRVVLASSVQTTGDLSEPDRPLTARDSYPRNHYALTKIWAERMGEMYARCYGLSVIAARIAWTPRRRDNAQHLMKVKAFDQYVSPLDLGRFFACAVEAEPVPFAVLYAAGPDGGDRFDLDTAREDDRLRAERPLPRRPAVRGGAMSRPQAGSAFAGRQSDA